MGAFDNFTPPAPSAGKQGGAFSNFQPPDASTGDIAQPDTLPALDRNSTVGDYLLKLHQAAGGLGQIGQYGLDYVRAASNVYGEGDFAPFKALYGDITGQRQGNDLLSNLAAERAKTAEAEQRLGPAGRFAAGMTGAGPLGAVATGLGSKVAPYVGNWAGGMFGGGVTAAGSTAAGEFDRGENISPRDIALSTLAGAAGGVPGGVVGRGGALAPAVSAADLKAQAQAAYKPLENILYDAKSEVHPELDVTTAQNALRDWSGYKWGDATKTSGEIKTLLDKPQLSANDLQQSQRYLGKITASPTADPNDKLYAGYFKDKLQGVLENGMPFAGVPTTAGPGYAAQVKAAGDLLHGRAEDVGRLNDWIAKSQVAGGPDVGGQASAYLRTKPGQTFAAPGTSQYDALNALAKTNAGPDLTGAPSVWDVRHAVHPFVSGLASGAVAGVGGQIAEGHFDPMHLAAEAATGAVLGYGLHKGVPWAQQKFIQGPAQQRAIDAARSTLSSGQFQAPVWPDANFRDAVRTLIYSQGARGAY